MNRFTQTVLWLFFMQSLTLPLFSQNCASEPCLPTPGMEVVVQVLKEPAICADNGRVRVIINNNNLNQNMLLPCEFHISLDEPGEDDIIFTGGISDPDFQVQSGLGTANPVIEYVGSGVLPPLTSTTFSFNIKGSCSLLELLTSNGNTIELENNQVLVDADCAGVTVESESFNILYSQVTIDECNDVEEVNVGELVSVSQPISFSGDFCSDSLTIIAEWSDGFEPDQGNLQATYLIGINGTLYLYAPVSTTINGNQAIFVFDANSPPILGGFPNPVGYCEENDGILFTMRWLKVTDCPGEDPLSVTLSATTCENTSLDETCPVIQSSSTCYYNVPLGNADLTIEEKIKPSLTFCNDVTILYEIDNASTATSDNGFGLNINLNSYPFLIPSRISINGSPYYELNIGFLNWVNGAHSTGAGDLVSLNGQNININTNFAATDFVGTTDIDCDEVFSELGTGDSLFIAVQYTSTCPFDPEQCPSYINDQVYSANINWNNQCGTLAESASISHSLFAEGDATVTNNLPGPFVQDGQPFSLDFCINDWILSGFGSPFSLGNFFQFLQIDTDLPELTLVSVTYEDQSGVVQTIPVNQSGLIDIPLGLQNNPPLETCFTANFILNCDPGGISEALDIGFTSYGFWDSCPGCQIQLGCDEERLYPACPGDGDTCDFAGLQDMSVERVTPPGGTNNGGAYLCDEVIIELNGFVNPVYNDPLFGCFGVPPAYADIFDNFLVTATVNGNSTPVNPVPTNQILNIYGDDYLVYTFETNPLSINLPSNVTFTINARVNPDVVEPLGAGIHELIVVGTIGEISQMGTFQKCGIDGRYFDVYRVVEDFTFPTTFHSCNDPVVVPVRIGYNGGTPGDDFPGEYRPINQFFDDITISGGSNFTVSAFGEGPAASITIQDIQNLLGPPSDKTSEEGVSQSFNVEVFPNDCSVGEGSYSLDVSGNYIQHLFSNDCQDTLPLDISVPFYFRNGDLETQAVNPIINTVEDCVTLTTNTYGIAEDSETAWIQFEYDPNLVTISPVNPGNNTSFVTSISSNLEILTLEFTDGVPINPATVAEFEVCFDSVCDNNPLIIPYYVGKVCAPEAVPNPAIPAAQIGAPYCIKDSDEFEISIKGSGLNMNLQQCTNTENLCDIVYYSAVLRNDGEGNTFDVGFAVDLPPGMEIVEGSFTYPFNPSSAPCSGSDCNGVTSMSAAQLEDMANGGVFFPNALDQTDPSGGLPGTQLANSSSLRHLYICVGLRADCTIEPGNDDVTFRGLGRRNCGDTLILINDQFHDFTSDWITELNAEMLFNPEVEIDCENGEGEVQLTIAFPPGLNLPAGQEIELFLETSPNISINSSLPILVPYDPNNPVHVEYIPIVLEGEITCPDSARIRALVMTSLEVPCGERFCTLSDTVGVADLEFPLSEGEVLISDVEISQNLCPENGQFGPISFLLTNVSGTPGLNFTAYYYCGTDATGTPILQTTGTLPAQGQTIPVSEIISNADFNADCPDGIVTVDIQIEKGCICVEGNPTDTICCECPEYELTAEYLGNNTFAFTITPDPDPAFPPLYCYYENGTLVFPPWDGNNPFIYQFEEEIPDTMCVRVESLYEPCEPSDSLQGGEKKTVLTDPPCSDKYCVPLKECILDFDFEVTQTGELSIFMELTSINTNIANPSYEWFVGGTLVGTGTSASAILLFPQTQVCLRVSGTYLGEECKLTKCIDVELETILCDYELDFSYSQLGELQYTFAPFISSGGKNLSYTWHFGDGNSSNAKNPSHTYKQSGTYLVSLEVVDESKGCALAVQKWITVGRKGGPEIQAGFDYSWTNGYELLFENQTTGAPATARYKWHFGDGEVAGSNSPIHTYTRLGKYPVTLEVYDENGRILASQSRIIDLEAIITAARRSQSETTPWSGANEEAMSISVFPNPVMQNQLFVAFDYQGQALKEEKATIQVFDATGKLILEQPVMIASGVVELDIEQAPSGILIVSVNREDGYPVHKVRIMKQ